MNNRFAPQDAKILRALRLQGRVARKLNAPRTLRKTCKFVRRVYRGEFTNNAGRSIRFNRERRKS